MKRVAGVFGIIAALCCGVPAMAAGVKRQPASMPTPIQTWEGAYVGLNAGYSWGPWASAGGVGNLNYFDGSTFVGGMTAQVNGWLAGVQLGRNWQRGQWVYGFEIDAQLTGERASNAGQATATTGNADRRFILTSLRNNEWKLPWFATFRARFGFEPAQSWLLYATGGLALGGASYSSDFTNTLLVTTAAGAFVSTATTTGASSEARTNIGWTLGAGVQKAIDDRWSVKAEYLYLDFGTQTFLAGTGLDTRIRLVDHIARIGVSYKFMP